MSVANLNNFARKSFFIQILTGWTLLVLAGYFVGKIWIQNDIATHVLLWALGATGIYLAFYLRRKNQHENINNQINDLLYHAIIETSPDSVTVTDLLGNFIFCSKQTAALHGYKDPAELIGTSAFKLFPINEVASAAKYMDLTRKDGVIKNVEFNLLRLDGSTFPAELSAAMIKNEFGIPVAFMAIVRDITERKRVADKLHDMNDQLRQQLKEIEKLQSILREQAIQDPLTGLYNRRYMEEALKQEFARASRENYPFTIVMLDMDNLKELNDKYGHIAGDEMLRSLAHQLKDMTRTEDIVCRYGGDEFLVILHNADEVVAQNRIAEWVERARNTKIHRAGEDLMVSFSAGSATYPTHGDTIEKIIHLSDAALYKAKAKRKKSK